MNKAIAASRLPFRRALSEAEAALYVGLGTTKFREMVAEGRMPKPRKADSRKLWDIDDLDAAFKSLPLDGDDSEGWADFRDGHSIAAR